MFQRAWKRQRRAARRAASTDRVSVASRSSPWPDHHCLVAAVRRAELGRDRLLGQRHDDALRLGGVVLARAEVERPRLAGGDRPRSRASRAGACPTRRGRRRGCRAARPAPDTRLWAMIDHQLTAFSCVPVAARVVLVRQAEVVRVLVREHGHAAVLGLHRVVGDPEAGVADLRAAVLVERRAGRARRSGTPSQRCDQIASSPWYGSPSAWSPPAWTIWKWSM